MPLLKFLKSLGKKRKKKDQKDNEGRKEKTRKRLKQKDESSLASIEKQGMIPPQIHGQAVSSPVTARLGESLNLVVSVKGVPPPTIKWFYGTKEIKPCKEFRLKDDGLQYSLHIPKVTESLAKKGICISARNRLGEIKRRVDLKVYKVYSSRRHHAVSDSETAKSPDSILFRKKRKLKLVRPKSSPTLCSDSSGAEDEGGRGITYISTDSIPDDVVYETIRSSARHIEPPRLRPLKPAIYTDSSLYETYMDYRTGAQKTNVVARSRDHLNGDDQVEGAIGGSDQFDEMLNPRSWQPDPDYATIEDMRRRRQSPGTDRRVLTWKGVNSPSHSSELDSRRVPDDDDLTHRSLQYDPNRDDGSSDSRHPASSASENPYGSLHINSETPYGSLHINSEAPYGSLAGNSERSSNYGILKPARPTSRPSQEDHLKIESDNFDGYADISDDGSPYGTTTRSTDRGKSLQRPRAENGNREFVGHPRGSSYEAVNQLWAAQAEGSNKYKPPFAKGTPQTVPKVPYQEDYCGYMGPQQVLHPFFDDEANRHSYLPGLDIRNNPHVKTSDYDFSDHGYGTLKSTATDYDSMSRRNRSRAPQNEYVTYGQARQAMRVNSLGRHHHWSPVGGPYGKLQTGRESGYESGYMSGRANSESHYGIITFPPRHNIDGAEHQPSRTASLPRRLPSEEPYTTRAVPAPVTSLNPQSPPSPHSEQFYYRESFRSPASSPMSSPRIGRSPGRVKQTTEIMTMIKKVSPVRSMSLDRDSPLRRLPDVLASQSPRMQTVVGTHFAGELFCYVRKASPLSWESMQSDATDLEFGFITEPITTIMTNGFDVTDNRHLQASPERVPAVSQPSDGPVLSPPVTRRPPIPTSTTIIRSKSAGPGARYSSLRHRSPSPVRRSTQIRTYDITPTPSRFSSTTVTSFPAGEPATSSDIKPASMSISSRLPSPPSYSSIKSSVPLKPAPDTRYESETIPKVTSTIETVTETETVVIPVKASSLTTSTVMSQPTKMSSSSSLTSSVKEDTKSGSKTVTTTNIDGGMTSVKSRYVSPGSSRETTTMKETFDGKLASKLPSKPTVHFTAGKGKIVEEKSLTETETKFEFHTGNLSELFQGISDSLNLAVEGGSTDSPDGSSASSPLSNSSPLHNLSSIIDQSAVSNGGFPTLDRSFLETMRSTFGDPERIMSTLPENIQAILRNASCTSPNGHVQSASASAAPSTEKDSDKDSDKEIDATLSKIGKPENTNTDLMVTDGSSNGVEGTIANNTNSLGELDAGHLNGFSNALETNVVFDGANCDAVVSNTGHATNGAGSDSNSCAIPDFAMFDRYIVLNDDVSADNVVDDDNENKKECDVNVDNDKGLCSRDKFLQEVKNQTENETSQNQDPKQKEDEGDFDLDDDVFEETNSDDAEVSTTLDKNSAAFSSIEKGALEGILDLSIVNDILQFSDISSEDVLDDDEIEELSQLIIANISDDVRREIEKDITIKDYVKSVISQACANLQANSNTNESYRISPGDGTQTPEHLEGTFYEMEIIEDEEDEKLGQMSPRFLLPPRYDVDCESDQLSAITEEDDEEMMRVEDIPKDDESKTDTGSVEDNSDTCATLTSGTSMGTQHNISLPVVTVADTTENQEPDVHCVGQYEDNMVINREDVANGNGVSCVYEVSSKFKCVVENFEDDSRKNSDVANVYNDVDNRKNDCKDSKSKTRDVEVDQAKGNQENGTTTFQAGAAYDTADYHDVVNAENHNIRSNVKEITTTYDIQLVPIPIENSDKPGHSNGLNHNKMTMKYPEHGIDLEIEVSNQSAESKTMHQNNIYHRDYKTHAQANGIQENLSVMEADYREYTMMQDDDNFDDDDDDDEDDDDDSDEEAGMEYDLNDICDVLDFCGDPELQDVLKECLECPPYGEESPLDTPSDCYTYNGAVDEVLDPNDQFRYDNDRMVHVQDCYNDDIEADADNDQTASIDSGMDSRASVITSLASRNSERDSPESGSDTNLISKDLPKDLSAISECWTTTVTKIHSPSDYYICDIKPEKSVSPNSPRSNSIVMPVDRAPPSSDEFDTNIVCPKEPPILKPITRTVEDVGDTRIGSCDSGTEFKNVHLTTILKDSEFDKHMDVPKKAPILKPITRMVEEVYETRVGINEVLVPKRHTIQLGKSSGNFDDNIVCPKDAPILKPITRMVEDVHETRINGGKSRDFNSDVLGNDTNVNLGLTEEFHTKLDRSSDPLMVSSVTTSTVKDVHKPKVYQSNKSLTVLEGLTSEIVMDDSEFDSHIDIPTEPPILKPIMKTVVDVNEIRTAHSASENQALGASKNQNGSFVMLKNLFRIHVPKEILSSQEKVRFAAAIHQSDISVSAGDDTVVVQDNAHSINNSELTLGDSADNDDVIEGVELDPASEDDDDSMDDINEDVVNMLDDPSVMADITEAVQAESNSGDCHLVEAGCGSADDHQGEEEMRVIWHAHGLWDELKRNAGSFMLLLIAVILMQIVNHWLSVEGKED